MRILARTAILVGVILLFFGVHFLIDGNHTASVISGILAVVLFLSGACLFSQMERKEERAPVITDKRGNRYVPHIKTITNRYHDTYYSIQQDLPGPGKPGK